MTPANTPRSTPHTPVDRNSNSNNTPNLHQNRTATSRVNQLSVLIQQQEELRKEEMVQSKIEDEASSKPVKLPKDLSVCHMYFQYLCQQVRNQNDLECFGQSNISHQYHWLISVLERL